LELQPDLIFHHARIIDPQIGLDKIADIQIKGGIITEIAEEISSSGTKKIDLKGKIIIPGLFDMHTHLREPGREDEETITSGCTAAAAGGFTGIACMPNTNPTIDNSSIIEFIQRRSSGLVVTVHPIAAITVGREGRKLTEMYDLMNAGAVAFSDDGSPLVNTELMRRALEYASDFEGVIIQHAEDPYLFQGGVMHEGIMSTRMGLPGIPSLCEELMVARDLRLAEFTGGRLHFAHISTKESVELIRTAKKRGVKVTAEVTPHHLFLSDKTVEGFNTNAKMNPPLRTEEDRQVLIEALIDGTIDCIATDHAPHSPEEKEDDFNTAPFGIIGLETALCLVLTELLHKNKINWNILVERMAIKPREILNLPTNAISLGNKANLAIIDPELEWEVNPEKFKSLSRNTPFKGWKLKGKAWGIYNKGILVQNKYNSQ
jgi:dihydroorotase